jgi:hypothetical protein
MFTEDQKRRIVEELQKRSGAPLCRCGNPAGYTLMDGFFLNLLGDGKNVVIGGAGIPTAVIVCNNCGAIWQYAIGTLGLLKEFGLG